MTLGWYKEVLYFLQFQWILKMETVHSPKTLMSISSSPHNVVTQKTIFGMNNIDNTTIIIIMNYKYKVKYSISKLYHLSWAQGVRRFRFRLSSHFQALIHLYSKWMLQTRK
jgi:hypothetical protein